MDDEFDEDVDGNGISDKDDAEEELAEEQKLRDKLDLGYL